MVDPTRRVLLVDDHEVVRTGLRALIEASAGLDVAGEAATADDAIRSVGLKRPDVVVMDVRLPDGSGIDACRTIKERWPATQVLILTSFADDEALIESFDAGASGYVLKRVDTVHLLEAINAVAAGERMFEGNLDAILASRIRGIPYGIDKIDRLSIQERRVLAHLAKGLTNRQIADDMFLSEKTVKNYVSHVLTKLEMSTRTEAAAHAAALAARREARYAAEDWE